MTITKEQWDKIDAELAGNGYGSATLVCDGYRVVAVIEHIGKMRQGIVVYVNGYVKGEWYKGEAEEATKFHRKATKFLYSRREREEAAKMVKKFRRHGAEFTDYWSRVTTAKMTTWLPWFTNAKDFTRQLRRTCTDITLVGFGYQPEEVKP